MWPARKLRVEVEALSRSGPFAIEVRSDQAAPPLLVAHPVAAARLLGRLEAAGQTTTAVDASGAKLVPLEVAKLVRLPVAVAANTCVEIVVALDPGAAGLDLRLATPEGESEATVMRGREVVSDRICAANAPENAMAELRVREGKAEALVLLRASAR